uniref:hypoxia up-regulated protein 1 n=1 Tax=Euleptes europaea TaxID=460621 RepID=UPI0025402B2B|nr:hypoxia up-regulated protein 1 [Euleptes europaea]
MSRWALGALLLLACLARRSDSLAVMSVDLGSESMKIAIVKPGVPMEIVLNKESRRKTPVAVSLKENERLFGDSAVGMSIKTPKAAFRYFQDLLGKHIDNPQVALYQSRFPEHELVKDSRRATVSFRLSDKIQYSPEEVLGMVLNYSRSLAEEFAEQPLKDAVITVPAYFNQAERRAILHAAKMADLKVLQLINDNTAVALNYGVFRRKDINATAQNIMFYDMGAGSTVCTIVTYQTVKTKDSGTQPQLQILGVGFDRTLGGLEMELRLRDHLATQFNKQHPSKDVRQNLRAMAKLLKEANRLKTVLSANADHMAQIEGLLDDIDFKAKVSRQEFEDLCSDMFQRVAGPVHQALHSAGMSLNEIDQVILVGGATRVPKVQEILLKVVGKDELGKNINADEAAAMGAVYQAAALSKAFKVKPFLIRDAAIFPIQVEFTREVEEEDKSKSLKHNRRILFQRTAPYPQRKVITFNRYTDDFEFHVNYADMGFLSESDLRMFGSLNLTTVRLRGVGESFRKHTDYESKGIKAHFNMDESGVLSLDRVESVFETVVEDKPEEESTLTKLGNTISSLFGGGSAVPEAPENQTETVQEEEESQAESGKEDQKDDAGAAGEEVKQQAPTPSPAQEKAATDASAGEDQEEDAGGKSDSQEAKEKAGSGKAEEPAKSPGGDGAKAQEEEEEEKKLKPPKKQKLVEEITVELDVNDIPELLPEELQDSISKLQDLTARDLEKQERERSANSLEAFIFETQDKLYQEEYQVVSSDKEREGILQKLSEASSWMEEEGFAATTKELKERLLELKKLCRGLFFRVEERRKWPERLGALESLLNHSTIFLKGARMIPEADQIFTEVELSTLEMAINVTALWKNETLAEQSKLSPTEKPVLLSKDIELKIAALDREVQYLLNKAKFPKPKPKKRDNATKTEAGKNATVPPEDEKVIPPKENQEKPVDASPAKEPPTPESSILDDESRPDAAFASSWSRTSSSLQPVRPGQEELVCVWPKRGRVGLPLPEAQARGISLEPGRGFLSPLLLNRSRSPPAGRCGPLACRMGWAGERAKEGLSCPPPPLAPPSRSGRRQGGPRVFPAARGLSGSGGPWEQRGGEGVLRSTRPNPPAAAGTRCAAARAQAPRACAGGGLRWPRQAGRQGGPFRRLLPPGLWGPCSGRVAGKGALTSWRPRGALALFQAGRGPDPRPRRAAAAAAFLPPALRLAWPGPLARDGCPWGGGARAGVAAGRPGPGEQGLVSPPAAAAGAQGSGCSGSEEILPRGGEGGGRETDTKQPVRLIIPQEEEEEEARARQAACKAPPPPGSAEPQAGG